MRFARVLKIEEPILPLVASGLIETYKPVYPYLEDKQDFILEEIRKEEEKFAKTLGEFDLQFFYQQQRQDVFLHCKFLLRH